MQTCLCRAESRDSSRRHWLPALSRAVLLCDFDGWMTWPMQQPWARTRCVTSESWALPQIVASSKDCLTLPRERTVITSRLRLPETPVFSVSQLSTCRLRGRIEHGRLAYKYCQPRPRPRPRSQFRPLLQLPTPLRHPRNRAHPALCDPRPCCTRHPPQPWRLPL